MAKLEIKNKFFINSEGSTCLTQLSYLDWKEKSISEYLHVILNQNWYYFSLPRNTATTSSILFSFASSKIIR